MRLLLTLAGAAVGLCSATAAETVTDTELCKAAVAAMNGQSPRLMKTEVRPTGETWLSYVRVIRYIRPDDQAGWAYHCAVQGNRIYVTLAGQKFQLDNPNVIREFEVDALGRRVKIIETFKGETSSPVETWVSFSDLR